MTIVVPNCIKVTGYAVTFSNQATMGLTCTITGVVYEIYVDSTVIISAATIIQDLKIRNFAEQHSLRGKNR